MALANGSDGPPPFPSFNKLDTVQDVLDRNKTLINEIKASHAVQAPEELAKTCMLIKELGGNIRQVLQLYHEISDSYVKYMGLSPSEFSGPSPAKQTEQTGTGNDQAVAGSAQPATQQQVGSTPPPPDAADTCA